MLVCQDWPDWFLLIFPMNPLATQSQLSYLQRDVSNSMPPTQSPSRECPQPLLCPLSRVTTGTAVRIKQLSASPEVTVRLREMGFCEEQCIKLISRQSHYICQVCHARIGIHSQLAEHIWVEPVIQKMVA